MDSPPKDAPLVTFYRFIPDIRMPQRADNSAAGSIPTRAFRYCEAIRLACAFGWYVFPPIRVSFMWDRAIGTMSPLINVREREPECTKPTNRKPKFLNSTKHCQMPRSG